MSAEYEIYLKDHIANVQKGLEWIQSNIPELLNPFSYDNDGSLLHHNINEQFIRHDESKMSPDEYDAYDRYFYGGNRSSRVVERFNYAWLHHIHHNPHHWQYWLLVEDETGKPKPLEMPYCYILEMICDWWAFSWAKGNLYEIFDWYEKHKSTMILAPETRKIVEDILNEIREKMDYNIEEATNGGGT